MRADSNMIKNMRISDSRVYNNLKVGNWYDITISHSSTHVHILGISENGPEKMLCILNAYLPIPLGKIVIDYIFEM
jgi:hypothetical protein